MPIFALLMIAAPAAAASPPPAPMRALLQNCDAHKFETVVDVVVDGKPKQSKVKLCGNDGQTDADWLRTLQDAADKMAANQKMEKPVRDQVVAALKLEIARLSGAAASAKVEGVMPPPRKRPQAQPLSDFAALPPMPTAPTAPVKVLGGVAGVSVPLMPRPRLSLSCYNPNDVVGDGPCTGFERETMLTVRAEENLPAGTSLRFVRDGNARAEVQLAQLQRGKSMKVQLPQDVCMHSVGGALEIRIVRATKETGPSGQVVGKDGPYNLRC
jgi:hypothetical protein